MTRNLIIGLAIALFFASACSKKEQLNIAGSSTVLPIVSVAAENYVQSHSELSIIVNSGGSGVGINQLGEGQLDAGMMSRDIKQSELDRFPAIQFNVIPIAKDAVVAAVSSEIYDAGITKLSLSQIAAIYKGTIKNWKELGGPDKDILVIDKEASRGTRAVFMQAVFGNEEELAPGADLVLGSNNEEQTAVAQSDAAIGMLSLAWLNEDVKGLAIALNDSVTIVPSLENIINGSYPISRDLNLITVGAIKPAMEKFINYLLGPEGQKIVVDAGYVSISNENR